METLKPEHAEMLVNGSTPLQIIILVFLGVIVFLAIYFFVEKMISRSEKSIELKYKQFETIPIVLEEIKKELSSIRLAQVKIESSLWTPERMSEFMKTAILQHEKDCPLRNNKCKTNSIKR